MTFSNDVEVMNSNRTHFSSDDLQLIGFGFKAFIEVQDQFENVESYAVSSIRRASL